MENKKILKLEQEIAKLEARLKETQANLDKKKKQLKEERKEELFSRITVIQGNGVNIPDLLDAIESDDCEMIIDVIQNKQKGDRDDEPDRFTAH